MDGIIYTSSAMIVDGIERKALYRIEDDGSVTIWIASDDGKTGKTVITKDNPLHEMAAKAAIEAAAHKVLQRQATIASYEFAGVKVKGKSWTIDFSKEYDRTMIIFRSKPSHEIREALKAAKWNWSPTRLAWIKPLNRKGYQEAMTMHDKLIELTKTPA